VNLTAQIAQPRWKNAKNREEAVAFSEQVGFPCLVRPSYVLSGAAMNVAHNVDDLHQFLEQAHGMAGERVIF
jgi:carbamoyl-phosphate synthase / aspartate carbamoyltransferase / dihydroorotase